eukprot:4189542-Pyramimonas_sp.AAC.1
MWLSPWRGAHSLSKFARVSRIGGSSFSKCGSRLRAAHMRLQDMIPNYAGAAATLILCVEVLGMAFWRDSGTSKLNNQVHPCRWNP